MDVERYDLRQPTPHETDLARLRSGHIGAQFWSVYVPGELASGCAKTQLEQIDIARRMIAKYPEALKLALSAGDIERAHAHGKIASLIGMEGGHVIENSMGALRAYYELGARYMTLTHNVTLDWADAALGEPKHHGLTPFGKEVVREMNGLGPRSEQPRQRKAGNCTLPCQHDSSGLACALPNPRSTRERVWQSKHSGATHTRTIRIRTESSAKSPSL